MPLRPAWAIALVASLAACGLPRDAEGTLDRVRGGTLRVGVSERSGWVHLDNGRVRGCEAEIVRGLAAELDAAIEWTADAESVLFEKLRRHELDLVVAGIVKDTPWKKKIGLTRPFAHDEHVLAVPAGENAWLMAVDRYLFARQDAQPCG